MELIDCLARAPQMAVGLQALKLVQTAVTILSLILFALVISLYPDGSHLPTAAENIPDSKKTF